jgi:molecular chaperone DnaK
VDDVENRLTVLEAVFDKNALLPLNKTIYKMIARDMLESSNDSLVINILEGDKNANPSTNQVIGCITISPKDLGQNLFKDSDVGITLSISESRDLTVTASISQIDLEIKNVFSPTQKLVNLDKLREEFRFLSHCISKDLADALSAENFEQAAELQLLQEECNVGLAKIKHSGNIESDVKFYCDELKRKIAVRYDKFLKRTKLLYHIDEYRYEKENVAYLMNETDFPEKLKFSYLEIVKNEKNISPFFEFLIIFIVHVF